MCCRGASAIPGGLGHHLVLPQLPHYYSTAVLPGSSQQSKTSTQQEFSAAETSQTLCRTRGCRAELFGEASS